MRELQSGGVTGYWGCEVAFVGVVNLHLFTFWVVFAFLAVLSTIVLANLNIEFSKVKTETQENSGLF